MLAPESAPKGVGSDREAYRRAPAGPDKKGDVGIGADTKLEFVSVNFLRVSYRFSDPLSNSLVFSC